MVGNVPGASCTSAPDLNDSDRMSIGFGGARRIVSPETGLEAQSGATRGKARPSRHTAAIPLRIDPGRPCPMPRLILIRAFFTKAKVAPIFAP